MSLAALRPQFGVEMEDSAMQEDHLGDSAIAIDMESPKNEALTPSGMTLADAGASTTFWSHSQQPPETQDELLDVEFDTQGHSYEDDGMMTAAEIEMTTAPLYEENELEMVYEAGATDFPYELADAEVHDAEVAELDPHRHEDLGEGYPVALEHEALDETPVVPLLDTGTHLPDEVPLSGDGPATATDAHPPLEASNTENLSTETNAPHDATEEPTAIEKEPPQTDAKPASPAPDDYGRNIDEVSEFAEVRPPITDKEGTSHETADPATVADVSEPVEVPEAEPASEEAYTHEEETVADPELASAPPVLATLFSDITGSSTLVSLFAQEDASTISSTSTTLPSGPALLLDGHQYLFMESITSLLNHLRTELLHLEPEVISPQEFEYKEVQLVVRDLQLTLTEDNIYAREVTLADLEAMHRSCGLPGHLHLDISLRPRFIDRYRAIRLAIEAQGSAHADEKAPAEDNNHEPRNHTAPIAHASPGLRTTGDIPEGHAIEETAALQTDEVYDEYEDADKEPPPLPEDGPEGSVWSDEQEESARDNHVDTTKDHDKAEIPVDREDESNRLEKHEGEDEGDAYEEDFVHEDEYAPGDFVYVEDEDQSEAVVKVEAAAEAGAQDVNLDEDAETLHQLESEYRPADDLATAVEAQGADVPEDSEDINEEDERDELNDDWEEELGQDTLNAADEAAPPEPPEFSEEPAEALESNGDQNLDLQNSGTLPPRKRSFSEVEGEPEDARTLSPGSKKARLI